MLIFALLHVLMLLQPIDEGRVPGQKGCLHLSIVPMSTSTGLDRGVIIAATEQAKTGASD